MRNAANSRVRVEAAKSSFPGVLRTHQEHRQVERLVRGHRKELLAASLARLSLAFYYDARAPETFSLAAAAMHSDVL